MSAIRVLMLDDDNHTPSYHAEDTSHWHNANHFIKYLIQPHIPYEVRKVALIDIEAMEIDDIDHFFDIIDSNGRGHSFEEYQEAFDILWKYSEEI